MSRRSITVKAFAERSFGVRVHIRTPEGGFREHNDLQAFLREQLGNDFYIGSERGYGAENDSIIIYANDLDVVSDAVHRLGCEVNQVRNATYVRSLLDKSDEHGD
jgi:hypothetical protein